MSVGDFIDEVHLSFTHIADAYENEVDREAAHLHLIRSHCDGKAKEFIRSLPKRQKSKAVDLIAALRSAFNTAEEEERREVRAHGAMLELRQRKDEPSAKYARRVHRIADRIDPKYDSLLAIKFRDGFRRRDIFRLGMWRTRPPSC